MSRITIPEGLLAFAREQEAQWPAQIDALKASGVPLNNYDAVVSRADAQALMPEDVNDAFLKALSDTSAVLSGFQNVPVGRAQVRFPVLSALPIAYFVTGDTGLKQTTEINWSNKFLNIEELAVIVPIPDSVISDAEQPIWEKVMPLAEVAMGRALDAAVFFGTNAPASWPTNILAAATAAGNTAVLGTNANTKGGVIGDQSDLLALTEADGYDLTQAVASRSLKSSFRGARSSQGERFGEVVIGKDTVQADGVEYTFPMRGQWPTAVSTVRGILWDPAEFVVGVRQDVTWKLLTEAVIQGADGQIVYNLAQQDMSAMRLVMRVGWQVANTINYDQPVEGSRYPAGALIAAAS